MFSRVSLWTPCHVYFKLSKLTWKKKYLHVKIEIFTSNNDILIARVKGFLEFNMKIMFTSQKYNLLQKIPSLHEK